MLRNWLRSKLFPFNTALLNNTVIIEGFIVVVKDGMHMVMPVKIITQSTDQAKDIINDLGHKLAEEEGVSHIVANITTDSEKVEGLIRSLDEDEG